jgi:hypothetical protein
MTQEMEKPEAHRFLREMGTSLAKSLPAGMGFVLLCFDFGPRAGMYYTSNAQRPDVLNAMQEFIEKHQPPKEAHDG